MAPEAEDGQIPIQALQAEIAPKTVDYSGSKPIPSPLEGKLDGFAICEIAKHSTLSNKSKHADPASFFKRRDSPRPKALSVLNKCIFQHASAIDFRIQTKKARALFLGQKDPTRHPLGSHAGNDASKGTKDHP